MRKYIVYRNTTERVIVEADNPIDAITNSKDSYNWQLFENPRFQTKQIPDHNNLAACVDCSWKSDKDACRNCKLSAS